MGEVIAINEVFLDGVKFAHRGVLVLKKTIVQGQEMWDISVPLPFDSVGNRQQLPWNFYSEDVKEIFLMDDGHIAGFLFHPHMQNKSLIFDLAITEELDVPHTYDEMKFLKETISQTFSSTQIFTFDYEEVESHLASSLDRGKEVWEGIISYIQQYWFQNH